MRLRCSWRSPDAEVGSESTATIAVSSAKVLVMVCVDNGGSDVYKVYSKGPRILPWGTPDRMG